MGNIDSWGSGFVLNNITVTNNGNGAVSGWSVDLGFNQSVTVTNAWGIDLESDSGSTLTGTNVGYNANIGPGQSVSFGMQGTSGSEIGTPSCTVN